MKGLIFIKNNHHPTERIYRSDDTESDAQHIAFQLQLDLEDPECEGIDPEDDSDGGDDEEDDFDQMSRDDSTSVFLINYRFKQFYS